MKTTKTAVVEGVVIVAFLMMAYFLPCMFA